MADPASCVPPDPSVSGWWWLKLHDYEGAFKWSSPDEQGGGNGYWLYAALDGKAWRSDDATRAGYRILGPMPSHADVVEARRQIAQDGREIERLEAELTAAHARIAKLEAVFRNAARQQTTNEMSHADGMLADFEGAYDTLVENARKVLEP